MPTPRQMEKLAAAVGREPRTMRNSRPGGRVASRILGIRPERPACRRQARAARSACPDAAAVRNSAAYSTGLLQPLRPHGGNPEGRRNPVGRRPGSLEGSGPEAVGQHLRTAHRPPRRGRLLALVRVAPAPPGPRFLIGCPDGGQASPHALIGGDRKALQKELGKARAMANILRTVGGDAGQRIGDDPAGRQAAV